MRLLALDTSSVACSVALQAGDDSVARHEEQPRQHTRLLMPMIREVLADAGLSVASLDGIVLGNGPGSFIGMRIAASVAQGLAYGAGLRILPVSSLAAVAAQAGRPGDLVAVAQDAHMNEVYLGTYEVTTEESARPVTAERLHGQQRLDGLPACIAAGHGWHRYPALLQANRDSIRAQSEVLYPDARYLLRLAAPLFDAQAVVAEAVQPAYLRQKVAEKPSREPARSS